MTNERSDPKFIQHVSYRETMISCSYSFDFKQYYWALGCKAFEIALLIF